MVQTGKQILCAALSLVMALSLAACGNEDGEKDGGPLLYLTFTKAAATRSRTAPGRPSRPR